MYYPSASMPEVDRLPPSAPEIFLPCMCSGVIFARTTWPVRINGSSPWRNSSVNPPATNTPRVRIGPGISLRYPLPDIAATLLFRIYYNPKTSTSCPPSIQDFGLDSGLTFWSPFLATSIMQNTGVPLWPDDKQQHAWHDPKAPSTYPATELHQWHRRPSEGPTTNVETSVAQSNVCPASKNLRPSK